MGSDNTHASHDLHSTGHKRKIIAIGINPMGIISIGIIPMGIISVGIVPMGVIGVGIVSMGAITASLIGMGIFSIGYNTMGVITAGPLSMSRINLGGSKMQMPHRHHGHETIKESPHQNTYIIYENEDMASTSAKLMGCKSIHKVGNYWAPCEAPENKN